MWIILISSDRLDEFAKHIYVFCVRIIFLKLNDKKRWNLMIKVCVVRSEGRANDHVISSQLLFLILKRNYMDISSNQKHFLLIFCLFSIWNIRVHKRHKKLNHQFTLLEFFFKLLIAFYSLFFYENLSSFTFLSRPSTDTSSSVDELFSLFLAKTCLSFSSITHYSSIEKTLDYNAFKFRLSKKFTWFFFCIIVHDAIQSCLVDDWLI